MNEEKKMYDFGEYEEFPVWLFPEPVRTFIESASKSIGRDASFIALPMLSAFATAIGTTHCIELKPGWVEYPIIWTGIVGDSGTKKSPAIKTALGLFNKVQKQNRQLYCEDMEEYEKNKMVYEVQLSAWKSFSKKNPEDAGEPPIAPVRPIEKVFLICDATIEAICEKLSMNPRGLLMSRDELAGFINGLDQYKGKGSDQQMMLEMHSAGSIYVDRKTSGRLHVETAAVSITGGIQLQILNRVMRDEQFENGMMARFLLAHPPAEASVWSEDCIPEEVINQVDRLIKEMFCFTPLMDGSPIKMSFNDEAKKIWIQFYNQHNIDTRSQKTDSMKAVFSKLEGYAARIALIFHCIRWCHQSDDIDQLHIDSVSLNSAIELVSWFAGETNRIYKMMQDSKEDKGMRSHWNWILEHQVDGAVVVRDFYRARNLDSEKADEVMLMFEMDGLGQCLYRNTEGRASRVFEVNNAINTD
ncbi:MAG: hypothetical protein ACI9JK_001289 [Phycisphaerales bacterium]|jgi:hypothetical protein